MLNPLGLAAAASAADAGIHKKISEPEISGSGTSALIMFNEEMKDIMKIVKSLNDSGLLIKGVTKTTENETKKNKEVNVLI